MSASAKFANAPAVSFLLAGAILIAAVCPGRADAAGARHKAAPQVRDVADDFAALASQRPWTCRVQQTDAVPGTGWDGGVAQCAWQERLRMRRWTGPGGSPLNACVSKPAYWWTWARRGMPAVPARLAPWNSGWSTQSVVDERSAEKRIVIIRRLPDGQWSATEWRWNPSPRLATRRWQEGRWSLLVKRAQQFQSPPGSPGATREAALLRLVLDANVGARAAETGGDILNWESDGLCLQVDAAAPGAQQLNLPYSVDDSRLEQRAAMQLQLARRYPKAAWLSPFALVPAPPQLKSGAKFYAVWMEGQVVKAQLWIPTRGDGPLVRVRITTALPAGAARTAETPAVGYARHVLERELMAVAARWAGQHE